MQNKEIPENWKELVAKSAELSADANYESAKLCSSANFGTDSEIKVPTPVHMR